MDTVFYKLGKICGMESHGADARATAMSTPAPLTFITDQSP